ncbi:unnamed protein product [Darwinula stevensoni]|uniref:Uncharacterized protein n=1 Tax=Darwinula stevensoni TaxID=69355 RepID=A0A7R8XJE1_9CRUS|nr:unnamed protein product [Darwinula stevensoni]CAG0895227.1 unnamed protein product [Darwinula stevensoni]
MFRNEGNLETYAVEAGEGVLADERCTGFPTPRRGEGHAYGVHWKETALAAVTRQHSWVLRGQGRGKAVPGSHKVTYFASGHEKPAASGQEGPAGLVLARETLDNDLGMVILEKPVKEGGTCPLCTQDFNDLQYFSECKLISHMKGCDCYWFYVISPPDWVNYLDVASMTSEPVTYSASIVEHRTCHERITQGGLLPVNSICVTFSSTWCGESGAPLICKDSFSGFYRVGLKIPFISLRPRKSEPDG